jgi:hypothetical protein
MNLLIKRTFGNEKQTIGQGHIIEDNRSIFSFRTLELPWLNNQSRISCIPSGVYKVVKRHSAKFGNHFHITNVPDRSYILIHAGNYHTQILGCVLTGVYFDDINHDGVTDVVSSGKTMKKLLAILPDEFNLTIE